MAKVLVTELEYRKAESVFVSAAERGLTCIPAPEGEDALADAVRQHKARAVIVGVDRYQGPLYDALPAGGVIARFGIGFDGIDLSQATDRGILCTNTPGALDDSVAEHAIALMLAAARHVPDLAADTRSGGWHPQVGMELAGKTLAVVGCGAIGRRVARMAALGLRMTVVGCEVASVDVDEMRTHFGFDRVVPDFAEAVAGADFVSLHIPAMPATRHYLDTRAFVRLSAKTWLINTARGLLVDELALYDTLSAGQLAGAALDVFENEPYTPVHPDKDLRTLDNVIMTPHVGSSTHEACRLMAQRALRNIEQAQAGDVDAMDLLNPDARSSQRTNPS